MLLRIWRRIPLSRHGVGSRYAPTFADYADRIADILVHLRIVQIADYAD